LLLAAPQVPSMDPLSALWRPWIPVAYPAYWARSWTYGVTVSGWVSSTTCGSTTISLAIVASGDVSGDVRLQANMACSPYTSASRDGSLAIGWRSICVAPVSAFRGRFPGAPA